ncbi:MAG: hypothetical protein ACTHU0_21450 [Kofleriaceae bacterium]
MDAEPDSIDGGTQRVARPREKALAHEDRAHRATGYHARRRATRRLQRERARYAAEVLDVPRQQARGTENFWLAVMLDDLSDP